MTSQAHAQAALPSVLGLIFLAFPLHAAGRPADDRAAHLSRITVPMLFLQGTRDELADLTLLKALVERLGPRVTLQLIEAADHSFRVPARTGRNVQSIIGELVQQMSDWITPLLSAQSRS